MNAARVAAAPSLPGVMHDSLNFSHFVARKIWRKRRVSPRHGRAQRLQRRAPLRGLLVPMDTTFDVLQIARKALVGFQGRGFVDGVQPDFCHSLLLEAFIFQ
jgi:hypothetical protein